VRKAEVFAPDRSATIRLARWLGGQLRPGDVVCLYGNLGAGKTTFAKGVARALGIPERAVTSASFTILAEHEGRLPLYHIDFYRLDETTAEEIGAEEVLEGDGVSVVEWPERAEAILPDIRFNIRFNIEENGRRIVVESPRDLVAPLPEL